MKQYSEEQIMLGYRPERANIVLETFAAIGIITLIVVALIAL